MPRNRRTVAVIVYGVALALGISLALLQRSSARGPSPAILPHTPAPSQLAPQDTASEEGPGRSALAPQQHGAAPTWRVAGRLRPWNGVPSDEQAAVLGFAAAQSLSEVLARRAGPPLVQAAVDAEGRFVLEIPRAIESLHLWAAGRYLFSTGSVPLERGSPAESLELPVRLGAWIRATVRVADGSDPPLTLSLDPDSAVEPPPGLTPDDVARRFEVPGAGTYGFPAVLPGVDMTLCARGPGLGSALVVVRGEGGARKEVELVLGIRTAVSGRVLDQAGRGIAGARVRAVVPLPGLEHQDFAVATADGHGAFHFEDLPAVALRLFAAAEGFLAGTAETLDLSAEPEIEEVRLVLGRGLSLGGAVRLPGGAAVAGARIEVEFDPLATLGARGARSPAGRKGAAISGDDGSFLVGGLGEGPFSVLAQAGVEDWRGAQTWRSRATGVEPGTLDLELVLAAPLSISGRVLGPGDLAVTRFELRARRQDLGRTLWGLGEVVEGAFEDELGRFRLTGLWPGTWDLEVRCELAAIQVAPVPVALLEGQDVADLVLRLEEPLELAGRVVDPGGRPVAGASVARHFSLMERAADPALEERSPRAQSDADGRFRLADLPRAPVALVASAPGFAPSAPLRVGPPDPAPLELVLRPSAALVCEVYDASQRPVAAELFLQNLPAQITLAARADSDGRARLADLAPGAWQVTARYPPGADLGGAGSGDAPSQALAALRTLSVQLPEGGEARVVFGEPPRQPLDVRGRVLAGGRPLAGARLAWHPRAGSPSPRGPVLSTSDERGAFALTVDGAGVQLVQVHWSRAGQVIDTLRTVAPPEGEEELLVELGGGSLRGRVLGPDREPLAGITVRARSEALPKEAEREPYRAQTRTDAQGRYEFFPVPAGLFSLSVGGSPEGGAPNASEGRWGCLMLGDLFVEEGAELLVPDLELDFPAVLEGRVLDSEGRPAVSATIRLRDRTARVFDPGRWISTDAAGRFTCEVPAGTELWVEARTEGEASAAPVPARLESGQRGSVELRLVPATLLVVRAEGPDRLPLRVTLSVRDEQGREETEASAWDALRLGELHPGAAAVIGPLAPGRYRIVAGALGLRSAERSVRLGGEPKSELTLRLRAE